MAFWSKKKIVDSLTRYLSEQNVTWHEELDCITFELYFQKSGFSLYPYIRIDEERDELSIVINLKEAEDGYLAQRGAVRINDFNIRSPYFTAKIKEGILILEYNCVIDYDITPKIVNNSIESLFSLQEELDNL